MQNLFSDNLRVKMYAGTSKQSGQAGLFICPICSECGQEIRFHMPWTEVRALLNGGQVAGVLIHRNKPGVFVYEVPSHGTPHGGTCWKDGKSTRLPVRFTKSELIEQWRNNISG